MTTQRDVVVGVVETGEREVVVEVGAFEHEGLDVELERRQDVPSDAAADDDVVGPRGVPHSTELKAQLVDGVPAQRERDAAEVRRAEQRFFVGVQAERAAVEALENDHPTRCCRWCRRDRRA